MAAPTITTLPAAPSRQDPTDFSAKADALLGALAGFVTQSNVLGDYFDASGAAAGESAAAALLDRQRSEAAANSAVGAIISGSVSAWVSGTTYGLGAVVYSPINYRSYRRKVAGAGTTDPSVDKLNWVEAVGLPYGSIVSLAADEVVPVGWYVISATAAGVKTITNKPVDMVLRFNTALGVAGLTVGFAIGVIASGKTISVDWGDGTTSAYTATGTKTHTYSTAGIYDVRIAGEMTAFGSATAPTGYDKLNTVLSFNSFTTNYLYAFKSAVNLTSVTGYVGSSVTNIAYMFYGATGLTTLDVSAWDVSAVTDMSNMFYNATSLTTLDVSAWNVSAVTSMSAMFNGVTLTTLDVSAWDVSAVTDMSYMFRSATSLTTLDVSAWDVSAVTNFTNFLFGVTLTTPTYDAILIAWDALDPVNGLSAHFGGSRYTAGGAAATARASLISGDSWTITDGGSV